MNTADPPGAKGAVSVQVIVVVPVQLVLLGVVAAAGVENVLLGLIVTITDVIATLPSFFTVRAIPAEFESEASEIAA